MKKFTQILIFLFINLIFSQVGYSYSWKGIEKIKNNEFIRIAKRGGISGLLNYKTLDLVGKLVYGTNTKEEQGLLGDKIAIDTHILSLITKETFDTTVVKIANIN